MSFFNRKVKSTNYNSQISKVKNDLFLKNLNFNKKETETFKTQRFK